MKNNIYILIFLSVCVLQPLQTKADDKVCDNFSDLEWIQWFSNSFDMNVEIAELRNEYLFCRLESDDSENFIRFLYFSINVKNKEKIEKELQMPIHDDIDINKCIYNISRAKVNQRFKKWLICQLCKFSL